MSESEKFEKMDISELEEYVQNHPHDDCKLYERAWYVYACRLLDGTECSQNPRKALDYFEELAVNKKNSSAALQAGQCYYYGIGTSQNLKEALKYFKCASNDLGPISRTGYLWQGKCLLKMQKGQEAIVCLERVMEGIKSPKKIMYAKSEIIKETKCWLGMCYYYGVGVKEDKKTAFRYLHEASLGDGASLAARYYLARCYQNGIGTDANPERAEHWRSVCFEQDYKELVSEMEGMLGVSME